MISTDRDRIARSIAALSCARRTGESKSTLAKRDAAILRLEALLNPSSDTGIPARPNAITDLPTFVQRFNVDHPSGSVRGFLVLATGRFSPAENGSYAALEVLCSGDAGGFSTHTLIFNDEHSDWASERGHYCFDSLDKARADLNAR